jgi:hypothetical protein
MPQIQPLVASFNQSGGQTALSITNTYEKPQRKLRDPHLPTDIASRVRANLSAPVLMEISTETDKEVIAFSNAIRNALVISGVPVDPGLCLGYGIGMSEPISIGTVRKAQEVGDPMMLICQWLAAQGFNVTLYPGRDKNSVFIAPR